MSKRETKWSLKVHFLVVDNSVNRKEMRERMRKVNTMGERDKQTDRHIERKREIVDRYIHNSGNSGRNGSGVVTMVVVMGERDREKRDE